jgi:polyhydroxyalkanoate synthesis regulator phasin
MPKKKPGMTPEQQSESFRAKVRELVAAGELDPTEADAALDELVRKGNRKLGRGG